MIGSKRAGDPAWCQAPGSSPTLVTPCLWMRSHWPWPATSKTPLGPRLIGRFLLVLVLRARAPTARWPSSVLVDVRGGCGRAAGLWTCGGVVDVPPGHVGKPQARPQPQDTSATTRIPRSGATPADPTPGAARAGPAGPGGARPLTPPRRLWRHQGESPPPAVGIALDALRPARLYAGSRVIPRVRVSRRGFGAQDGVITPVMTGKTPPRGPKPRTSAQSPVQAGTEAGSEDVLAPRG